MAKKAWKLAAQATTAPKLTGNELIRARGYGEAFFDDLAAQGLKTDGAKAFGRELRVKLRGVVGNSYAFTIVLPSLEMGEMESAHYEKKIALAYSAIVRCNPELTRFIAKRDEKQAARAARAATAPVVA